MFKRLWRKPQHPPVKKLMRAVLTVTSISQSYDGGPPEVTLSDGSRSMAYTGWVHLPAIDGLACVRVGDEVVLIPGTRAKTGCP